MSINDTKFYNRSVYIRNTYLYYIEIVSVNKLLVFLFSRRKKDNELKKMQDGLNDMKKKNAAEIKKAIAKAFAEEEEYKQKILREKAQLDKVNTFSF